MESLSSSQLSARLRWMLHYVQVAYLVVALPSWRTLCAGGMMLIMPRSTRRA